MAKEMKVLLNGKLYCIMSNQQAMSQLLSLVGKGIRMVKPMYFKRGFAGLRDVFTHIKNIRRWNAQDRIAETHAIDYWRESLEFDGNSPVPFEIELFFRSDFQKRHIAVDTISREIQSLGGRIIQECVISDIFYHGMLVELPRIAIEELVNNYEEIEFVKG